MSVAMLDITNKATVAWLRETLEKLMTSLSSDEIVINDKNFQLPDVAFFVDSGSFENLPTYFQVHNYRFNFNICV